MDVNGSSAAPMPVYDASYGLRCMHRNAPATRFHCAGARLGLTMRAIVGETTLAWVGENFR